MPRRRFQQLPYPTFVNAGSPLGEATTNIGSFFAAARAQYNRNLASLLGYVDMPGNSIQVAPNVFVNPDYYTTGKGSGQVDEVTGQAGAQSQLEQLLMQLTGGGQQQVPQGGMPDPRLAPRPAAR